MKVLQVNCVYRSGSTGKITYDLHSLLLANGIDSVVCYGRMQRVDEPHVYKTCGELYSKVNHAFANLSGLMYGGCFFSTQKLIGIIEKERPDVVHLQCINGYFVNVYKLVTYLKTHNIPTVLTLHAEFIHTANCGHALDCDRWKTGCGHCPRLRKEPGLVLFDQTATSWKKMKAAFDGFDNLIVASVSPWLMERAKQSPILADKRHCVVLNGVDTEQVFFPRVDGKALRAELGIGDEKVIFHATPSFNDDPKHIKGGYYVLELAKRIQGQPIKIVVAGSYEPGLVVPDNVILLGRVQDQNELAEYYSMADLTLLTSQKETFSMICAESLCCGTPIVGFQAGAPEQISLAEYSEFVEYGNEQALFNTVNKWLCQESNCRLSSNAAAMAYSKEKMCGEYIEIYKKMHGG